MIALKNGGVAPNAPPPTITAVGGWVMSMDAPAPTCRTPRRTPSSSAGRRSPPGTGRFRRSAQPGARLLRIRFRAVGKQRHVAAVLEIHRAECGGGDRPEDGPIRPSPSQRRLRWSRLGRQRGEHLLVGLVEAGDALVLEGQPDVVHVDADGGQPAHHLGASSTPASMVRASVPWSSNASMVASGRVLTVSGPMSSST